MAILPNGNVVLLLHCDDAAGSTVLADSSQYAQLAKCYGTCALSTVQSMFGGSSVKTGSANGSFFAVGTNQTMDFGVADFTVESFVYPVSQGADGGAVFGRWDGTNNDFLVARNSDGSLAVYVNGSLLFSTSAGDLPLNAFAHVALVRASGVVTLYVSGAAKGSAAYALAIPCTHGVPLYFGQANQSGGATWSEAYYDEIRVSNGLAQYLAPFSPPTAAFGGADQVLAYKNVVINDAPIAYWPLNDASGTSLADVMSNPANATASGGVTVAQAAIAPGLGTCLLLDGSTNRIDIAPSVTKFAIAGAITVEGWVKYSQSGGGNIFSCAYNNGFRVQIGGGAGGSGVNVIFNAANVLSSPANLSPNTLYHAVVTASSSGVKIYVNGSLVASNTTAWSSMDGSAVSLGYTATGRPLEPMGGSLSNVAVYSKELSSDRIAAHYTSGLASPTASADPNFGDVLLLVQGDSNYVDSSASPLTGTPIGSVAVSTSTFKFGGGSIGFSGGMLKYPGATLYAAMASSAMTFEAWIYPTAGGSFQRLMAFSDGTATNFQYSLTIDLDSSNKLKFLQLSGNALTQISSVTPLPMNQWYHVALVMSAGTLMGFVNGVLQGSAAVGPTNSLSDGALTLGADSNNGWAFTGFMDDVRFTKNVARYTGNFTPPSAAFPNTAGSNPTDPYANNVSLLIHCDGANNSTTFTDTSSYVHAVTATGNCVVSTTNPKFGSGCALSQGAWVDHLEISNSNAPEFDLASADFTVEGWVLVTGLGASGGAMIGRWGIGPSTNADWIVYISPSRQVGLYINGGQTLPESSSSALPNDGNYHHVAVTRQGSTLRLFIDGTQVGTATFSGTVQNSLGQPMRTHVWNDNVNSRLDGRLDEIRITKGVARYTANFTVPTTAFPNPGVAPVIQKYTKFIGTQSRLVKNIRSLAPGNTNRIFRTHRVTDYYDGGSKPIAGKVTVNDNPDSRMVRLFDLRSARLLRVTWSAADGTYSFPGMDPNRDYFVVGHDYTKTFNAVIQDRVRPA